LETSTKIILGSRGGQYTSSTLHFSPTYAPKYMTSYNSVFYLYMNGKEDGE